MQIRIFMKVYLGSIIAFYNIIQVQASAIPDDVMISGIGGAKLLSGRSAIEELRKRAIAKDSIAKSLLETMPFSNIGQQQLLVTEYNKRIGAQRIAEAAGLDKEKHIDHDSLVVALKQEQLAFTDLVSSSSGDGAMVTTGSSSLRLQSGEIDIVVRASSGPIRPRLMQLLREYAEKISQMEKASGQQQFSEVLGGKPIGSSGNLTLDLMLGSYYQAISDIAKQSQALVSIQKAFYEMQSLYKNALALCKKTVKITLGYRNKKGLTPNKIL